MAMTTTRRRRGPGGAGKKQPEPDDKDDVMDKRELMTHLHAMKLWAQQASEEYREEEMKMRESKVNAKKRPATITLKRKRKEITDNRSDGGEEPGEEKNSGGESDSNEENNL